MKPSPLLVFLSLCLVSICESATIDLVNSYPAPYIVGYFSNSPNHFPNISCGVSGTCYISVQPAGSCLVPSLTVSHYTLGSGTSALTNVSLPSSGAENILYEFCLHPNPAAQSTAGSGFYFVVMPPINSIGGVAPVNVNAASAATLARNAPFVVLPFQQSSVADRVLFAAWNTSLSALLSRSLSSSISLRAAILPSCSVDSAVRDYASVHASEMLLNISIASTLATVDIGVQYSPLLHLWNMSQNSVGVFQNLVHGIVEGRLCFGINGFFVNSSFTVYDGSLSSLSSFPYDSGVSVRLATAPRVAGLRIFREEDGVSGAPANFYLASSQPGKSYLAFDSIVNSSSTPLQYISWLTSEKDLTTDPSQWLEIDIRDPSFPCTVYNHSFMVKQTAASLHKSNSFVPTFAIGSWDMSTAAISWTNRIDRTFAGNGLSTADTSGGAVATGVLCLYVRGIPLITSHVKGVIFTIMGEGPSTLSYVPSVTLSPLTGSTSQVIDLMALMSTMAGQDQDISFNFSYIAPQVSRLRFAAVAGSCLFDSQSSVIANSGNGIVAPVGRFLTMPGASWLSGRLTFVRLCVGVISNLSSPDLYYFSDASVPIGVVVMPFQSIGLEKDADRYFPLNAPSFSMATTSYFQDANSLSSSNMYLSFASTPDGCFARKNISVDSTASFGTASSSNFGVALRIDSCVHEIGTLTLSSGPMYYCMSHSAAVLSPMLALPCGEAPRVWWYSLWVNRVSVSAPASSLIVKNQGGALISVYASPVTGGAHIPIDVLLQSSSDPGQVFFNTTKLFLRLSKSAGGGCTTVNGGSPPLQLKDTLSSIDSLNIIRIDGTAFVNITAVPSLTGLWYLCFSTTPWLIDVESAYSVSTFPIGIVTIETFRGYDVSGGPYTASLVGVIQYVEVQWVVTGRGFNSAGGIHFFVGSSKFPFITVVNDTYAVLTFSPQTAGKLPVNMSLGNSIAATYYLLSVNVIGVSSVGRFGLSYFPIFAQQNETIPIVLTSLVSTLPSACISADIDAKTAECQCIATAVISVLSTTQIQVDLSGSDSAVLIGNFDLCLRYSSSLYYTTKHFVHILPKPLQLGETVLSSSVDQNYNTLRGTSPDVSMKFEKPIPTAVAIYTIAFFDAFVTSTLQGGKCSYLKTMLGATDSSPPSTHILQIGLNSGSDEGSGQMPSAMTNITRNETRRLCAAILLKGNSSSSASFSEFIIDFNVVLVVGDLTVNGILVNNGTNYSTPILSQANTTLYVNMPSTMSAHLYFGVASSSCENLPTNSSDVVGNQSIALSQLSLVFTDGANTSAGLIIPAGIRYSSDSVMLCAQWLASQKYTFTGVFLTPVYFTALDGQDLATDTVLQQLNSTAGAAVLKNTTRSISIEGDHVESPCLRLSFLTLQDGRSCSNASIHLDGTVAQTTQQFTFAGTSPTDYAFACITIFRPSTSSARCAVAYTSTLLLDFPFSILAFSSFDVDVSPSSTQQVNLMAILGVTTTSKLFGLGAYDWNTIADRPFVTMALQDSLITSCTPSKYLMDFPLTSLGPSSLGVVFNITTIPNVTSLTSFTVCLKRNFSATTSITLSIGMSLLLTSLTVGGETVGDGAVISVTVGKAPELVVTGANLNLLVLYLAVTDLGSCSSFDKVNDVGISRQPSLVVSCSSSRGSVAFTSATKESNSSLMLCVAGVPSQLSSIKPSSLSLTFVPANLRVSVTQTLSLKVYRQPSAVASSDGSLKEVPILAMVGSANTIIQNVPSGISINATWVAVPSDIAPGSKCDCDIKTDGEAFLLSSATPPSLPLSAKFGVSYALRYVANKEGINATQTDVVKRGLCPATQFGQLYASVCQDCLPSTYCTGDVEYTMKHSYWRANNKTNNIYDCKEPYAAAQCLANTSTGTCTEGHKGARCSECIEGYGKSFNVCVACDSYSSALVMVIGMAIGYCSLVVFATISSVTGMDDVRETKHLPMLIKLVSSHMAMASTVGQFSSQFPALLGTLFSGMQSTSRPSSRFASLDCSLAPTTYQRFLFIILIPASTFIFVFLGSFLVRLLHKARDSTIEQEKIEVASMRESLAVSKRVQQEQQQSRGAGNENVSDGDEGPSSDGMGVGTIPPADTAELKLAPSGNQRTQRASSVRILDDTLGSQKKEEAIDIFGIHFQAQSVAKIDFASFDELDIATDAAEKELREREEEVENYEKAKATRLDTKSLFLLALIVVLLFGYPTIVEEDLNMLKCDSIDFGEILPNLTFHSDVRRLYFFDRNLDCDSSEHQLYTLVAYLALLVYGIGIPVASIGLIIYFRKTMGEDYTNRLFVFLVCGYDQNRWWWETVIMWRKLALAFILVFVDDQRLQTYLAIWILMLALTLHIWLEPYDEVNMDRLGTISLAVVIVTLNFSLLYDYLPADSSDMRLVIGNITLTVILFLINAAVVGLLTILVFLHGLMELQYQISLNQKVIRSVFPKSVQGVLFRFAQRPIIMFQKIMKKHEREAEKRRRIRHVLNGAESDLVELVKTSNVDGNSGAEASGKPNAKSGRLKKILWGESLDHAVAKTAQAHQDAIDEYEGKLKALADELTEEKQHSAALGDVLSKEQQYVAELQERYNQLLALLGQGGHVDAVEVNNALQESSRVQESFISAMNDLKSAKGTARSNTALTLNPDDLQANSKASVVNVVATVDDWSPQAKGASGAVSTTNPPTDRVQELLLALGVTGHSTPSLAPTPPIAKPKIRSEVYQQQHDDESDVVVTDLGGSMSVGESHADVASSLPGGFTRLKADTEGTHTQLTAKARKRAERILQQSRLISY